MVLPAEFLIRNLPTRFRKTDSYPPEITLRLDTGSATAISRFRNESFATETTPGTYTANGSTVGWEVNSDGSQIFYNTTKLDGKTFTLSNLRTDLGNLDIDVNGNINATNGSTIGKLNGTTITLFAEAVHKPAAPRLTGTNAADFMLVLPT